MSQVALARQVTLGIPLQVDSYLGKKVPLK